MIGILFRTMRGIAVVVSLSLGGFGVAFFIVSFRHPDAGLDAILTLCAATVLTWGTPKE